MSSWKSPQCRGEEGWPGHMLGVGLNQKAARLQTKRLNILLRCTAEAILLLNRPLGGKAIVRAAGFAVEQLPELLCEAIAIAALKKRRGFAAASDFTMHRQIAEDARETISH